MRLAPSTLVFPLVVAAAALAQSTVTTPGAMSAAAAVAAAAAAAASPGNSPAVGPAASSVHAAGTGTVVAATASVRPSPVLTVASAQHETSITLDVGFGIRPAPPSRITVPLGEKVRVTAPRLGDGVNYIWTKDGQAIASAPDSNVFVIDFLTSNDAGTYACLFSTPSTLPQTSQSLVLGVGPTDRLLNLSTRGIVGPGDQSLTNGFSVSGTSAGKKLILRAVGPSLAQFGVPNPLLHPVLNIYDSNGRLYENRYVYPAVIGGPTFESALSDALARTGAFPIPAGTRDVVEMRPFTPGSYTVSVTSGDGATGAVLLEIYEVP
jgi:hypothetical protein